MLLTLCWLAVRLDVVVEVEHDVVGSDKELAGGGEVVGRDTPAVGAFVPDVAVPDNRDYPYTPSGAGIQGVRLGIVVLAGLLVMLAAPTGPAVAAVAEVPLPFSLFLFFRINLKI